MPVEDRKKVLEQDFGIPMQEEIEERMSEMCNLSQDIKYEALREGEAIGIKKGERRGIRKGERRGIKKGERRGIKKGRKEGKAEERISLIRVLLDQNYNEESIINLGFSNYEIKNAKGYKN